MKRFTLREARERKGLTQMQLAKIADMEQTHISAIETGRRVGLEMNTLKKLSEALDMNGLLSVSGLVFEEKQS